MLRKERRASLFALCGGLVAVWASVAAGAEDWPQWRGPSRDGAAGVKLPEPWPASPKQVWKVEVGEGHSGPVVVGGKVVVLARQEPQDVVLCLNAGDGQQVWRYSYEAPYTPAGVAKAHGKGPFATPTVAANKVYAFGASGVLTCLDLANGKLLWQKVFSKEFKKTYPTYGASNSPLIEGDLCILGVGGSNSGALAAFNKDSGEPVWKLGVTGPGYGSPVALELAGTRQVVAPMQNRVVGVEPATGKLLWEVKFTTPHEMNIMTPVAEKGIFVYAGYQSGATAWQIAKDGEKLTPRQAWRDEKLSMFMSSPVVHGDHLYGFSDRGGGSLVCVAVQDGKTQWTSPGRLGQYASITRCDGKLLVMKTNGELVLAAADPAGYKELGRSRLSDSPVWAHLALAGGRLYVKDRTHLACFALAAE